MKTALLFELMAYATCSPHGHGGFGPWSTKSSRLQPCRFVAPTFCASRAPEALHDDSLDSWRTCTKPLPTIQCP
jgi:hypothetical protein